MSRITRDAVCADTVSMDTASAAVAIRTTRSRPITSSCDNRSRLRAAAPAPLLNDGQVAPRVRGLRVERDRALEMHGRFIEPALHRENQPEVAVRAAVGWIELHCA